MNYYPHHIGDFNNATRHLTRVERALYRDAIELYYDTEQPLPVDDFDKLAKRLLAVSEEEKSALKGVLIEFFTIEDGVYRNSRCDAEIAKYRASIESSRRAGKASAEKRQQKATGVERKSTGVERALNDRATEGQPTKNQEPRINTSVQDKKSVVSHDDIVFDGSRFQNLNGHLKVWSSAYPAIDLNTEISKAAAWLVANPKNKKKQLARFINGWLSRAQERAPRVQSSSFRGVI